MTALVGFACGALAGWTFASAVGRRDRARAVAALRRAVGSSWRIARRLRS